MLWIRIVVHPNLEIYLNTETKSKSEELLWWHVRINLTSRGLNLISRKIIHLTSPEENSQNFGQKKTLNQYGNSYRLFILPESDSYDARYIHIFCTDVNECSVDPTLCRGQTHGACYNTPGGYQCGCGLGYHAHYFSATGTGSFTCLSEYMFDSILFQMIVVDRNTSLPSAT